MHLILDTELWIVEEMVKYIAVQNILVSAFFGAFMELLELCVFIWIFVTLSSKA